MSKPEVIIYSHYDESAAFIEGLINNLGCSVRRCTNAPETLSLCAELKPSLLIVLNGCLLLNGSELIERLRPSSRHDPAIYVVSWQQSEQAILSLLEIYDIPHLHQQTPYEGGRIIQHQATLG